MKAIVRTDCGKVRQNNQDSFLNAAPVFAVADGMGGHKGGETASALAVSVLEKLLSGKKPEAKWLTMGVDAANRRIRETGKGNPDLEGMGTTLDVFWEDGNAAWIAHVGDSRVYRFRCGELTQLTEDHSLVGEMLRTHLITPELAKTHPYRNIITKAVGVDASVEADLFQTDILPGDLFLLCSDGLTGMVEDSRISEILRDNEPEAAADLLLSEALEAGGTDNITLLLLSGKEAAEC